MVTNRITSAGWEDPIYIDGVPLELEASLKVINHSPTGFAWGYLGSGPAQLALAILLRFTSVGYAVSLHQRFKEEFVAQWPQDRSLDEQVDVRAWMDARIAEQVT